MEDNSKQEVFGGMLMGFLISVFFIICYII